jgi:hypothetical protein
MPGVQKIEDAIFQRVPFILVKLGIVADVAEVRLVEPRGVRREGLGTGVDEAGEVHLRLAVGDRDRAGGVFLFRRRARIDRIRLKMRPATNAEYCFATAVVIAQPRLILAVDLEFPGAFPDIAGGVPRTDRSRVQAAIPSSLGYIDMASPQCGSANG